MEDLDDVVREFLIESHDNLDQLERDLVVLEERPGEAALISSIFRTIHTIKGTCGFLGYAKLERLTHVAENLLDRIRSGDLALDAEVASALLRCVDDVRDMLAHVENSGNDGTGDYSATEGMLSAILEGRHTAGEYDAPPAPAAAAAAPEPEEPAIPAADGVPADLTPAQAPSASPAQARAGHEGEQEVAGHHGAGEEEEAHAPPPQRPATPPRASMMAPPPSSGEEGHKQASAADASVRVSVDVLDRLMNLVGELVLARNQILRFANASQDTSLVATIQRLNQVTVGLQEGVMTTRMQPIGNLWSKLPRQVRDVARTCRKQVRVEMEGKDTGLDKTLIEAIKDPLTHLVRNAVDHGVERPDVRVASGKDPVGVMTLRAYHEGGQVNIEISDDGAGIDPRKLLKKAIEKNLITQEQGARLTERQMMNLIFLPGFSTAEKVTNVSGRGVGMDVVKTNVEKIGGTIDIVSELGSGTTFKVRIPLTLAIVPALIVRAAGDRYAIPQVSLLELVRIEPGQDVIEKIRGASVYHLRGRLLPLLYLDEQLGVGLRHVAEHGVRNIVVVQAEDQRFGIVVDEVHDTEEIVVKPLGKHIKSVGAFAGATIMGDGQVALILDVAGLARRGEVGGQRTDQEVLESVGAIPGEDRDAQALLLVQGRGRRLVVPLMRVTRLEEIALADVEKVGNFHVVQYRGGILPLLHFELVIPALRERTGEHEVVQVVVFEYEGLFMALVVEQIIDIVVERLIISDVGRSPEVVGSAIVSGRLVEVLDLDQIAMRSGVLSVVMENVA